jgi:hypothetical protein
LLSSSQSRSIPNPDYQNVYNINNENHQTVHKDRTKACTKYMSVIGIVVLAIIAIATVFGLGVVTGISSRKHDFNLGLKS